MNSQKVIVITGASSGIGASLTRALSADGHRLFVCGRREDRLLEVTQDNPLARWQVVDVANNVEVEAFARMVYSETPMVDALICCAGTFGPIGLVTEIDPTDWWRTLQTNLLGTFLAIHHFVPLMKSGDGRIITFSGGGAFNPLPRCSSYASSKAAVVRLTETIAQELQSTGISANCIAPGFINTEIHQATLNAGPVVAGSDFFSVTKAKLSEGAVPMHVPIDCIRFLLSDLSRGLTGKTISANFDPWSTPNFQNSIQEINESELYTMRRVNFNNFEPVEPISKLFNTPADN